MDSNHRGYQITAAVAVLLLSLLILPSAMPQSRPTLLRVDATDIARKWVHAELTMPVRPGPLTLVYPKWIPGYHMPVGPLNNVLGLKISANGQVISWKRDAVDMYAFHLDIPQGANSLDISIDFIFPTKPPADLGAATARLFVLEWNEVLLYPQGAASDDLPFTAQVRLPAGWKYACALPLESAKGNEIQFKHTSLTTLVDSPLLAGEYFKTLEVNPGEKLPVYLDLAAEHPEDLNVPAAGLAHYRKLITEAGALFGAHHYTQYHFLVAMSDELGEEDGTEHHESSDNRLGDRMFLDEAHRLAYAYLLPHEYGHSWNGKYRRPIGLATSNYQVPQTGELLWVYEGLERYLNWVLAARAGFFTPEQGRDYAALLAAGMDHRSGREWRSLEDTAISVQLLYYASDGWQSLRRATDYYDESLLIWLDADTTIRRETAGKRSLNDFCRVFYGPPDTGPMVKPYTFEDVVNTLNGIAPLDWKKFFEERLNRVGTDHAPLNGLVNGGWDLEYGVTRNPVGAARDIVHQDVDERFSVGLVLKEDGTITDIIRDSAAWKANIGPGMKVVAVNGHAWSPKIFRQAIAADENLPAGVVLRLQNGTVTFNVEIKDHRGAQYPRLERNANPDLVSEILKPLT